MAVNRHLASVLALGMLCAASATAAEACPFCAAPSRTLGEEMAAADVTVIGKLVELSRPSDTETLAGPGSNAGKSTFEIVRVFKGKEHLGGTMHAKVFHFGNEKIGTPFLITAMALPELKWATPIPLSDAAVDYISQLLTLPEKGPERLAFFQDYFEHDDSLLAQDAYDEFARAPYSDVQALGPSLQHDKLVAWIKDADTIQSRRRLYLTLLGVCGTEQDVPMLEAMMKSDDRRAKAGLDAMIGCYLALQGPAGMKLVEDLFLKKKDAEYSDTYGAIMAIRVMGQESDVVPKPRLLEGLRHMLDRPDLADLVIPDLARWEDWSVLEKLVQLFKDADDESNFIRVPVVNYLQAAARQDGKVGRRAKEAIDELEKVDPDAVKRAKAYQIFGPLVAPKRDTAENQPAEEKQAPDKEKAPSGSAAQLENNDAAANAAGPAIVKTPERQSAAQSAAGPAEGPQAAAQSRPPEAAALTAPVSGKRLAWLLLVCGAVIVGLRIHSGMRAL